MIDISRPEANAFLDWIEQSATKRLLAGCNHRASASARSSEGFRISCHKLALSSETFTTWKINGSRNDREAIISLISRA